MLSSWCERGNLSRPSAHAPGKRAGLLSLLTLPFPDTFLATMRSSLLLPRLARPSARVLPAVRSASNQQAPTPHPSTTDPKAKTTHFGFQTVNADDKEGLGAFHLTFCCCVSHRGWGWWSLGGTRASKLLVRRAARREQEGRARSSGPGRNTGQQSCCPFSQSSCHL